MLTRRQATLIFGTTALASIAGLELFPGPARAADPSPADLAMPGPLGDVWLGSPDAKCTIIEYATMPASRSSEYAAPRLRASTLPRLSPL